MNRNYPNINRRSLTCILPVFCLLLMCFICLQARAEEVEEEKIPSGLGQACLSEIMTKNKATLRDPDGIADQSFADAIVTDLSDVIPLLRQ